MGALRDALRLAKGPELSRRSFLVGSVGASVMMAFAPLTYAGDAVGKTLADKKFSPSVWFEINTNGEILINIKRAEMGQHIGTALARIVADELGANWDDVRIRHVGTDPKWGYMITGGSWSVFQSFKELSQAGAAGRMVLLDAGAALLGVGAAQCRVENSRVSCADKSVSFADIVAGARLERTFTANELQALPVKPASQRQLIGKHSKALDIPDKSTGLATYGIDVELPGMVYARPVIPPTRYGSEIDSVDDSAAKQVPGYLGFEQLVDPSEHLQGWVAVLATDYPAAIKAADAITVKYRAGPTAVVSEADILAEGQKLVANRDSGALLIDSGDVEKARQQASTRLEAVYQTSSVLHFALEPVNAVVEYKDGLWQVHTGNQWQSLTLPPVAKALGVAEDKVVIYQYYLGGGFGRRLYGDYIIPAALTAKAVNKPVKMVFTRADDSRFDCVRSPSVQRFEASLDAAGKVTGIEHAAAAGWPTLTMAPGFMADGIAGNGKIDMFSINGADHWYSLPNHRVRAINNDLAQKTFLPGWLRSVGPGWVGFGVESFMDELAHASHQDPIEFRLGLLDGAGRNAGQAPSSVGGAGRLANVLAQLKAKTRWGRSLPTGEGLGVATACGQERNMPTWIACAAHVGVDKTTGKVRVRKLSMVIDCGTVVHPDGALAQAEGASLWGLSLALHEGTSIAAGQVSDNNLDTYTPLRMADVPELDISFVKSDVAPVGLGEPPLIAVAPAIANAIYAAVGVRVRDLPIRAEVIRAALA